MSERDDIFAFWQIEAGLSVLKKVNRLKFGVAIFFTAIGVIALYAFGLPFGIDDWISKFVAAVVLVLSWPTYFAFELWHKGGEAGVRLVTELEKLNSKKENQSKKLMQAKSLKEIGRNLTDLKKQFEGDFPVSGSANTLPVKQYECIKKFAEKFNIEIRRYNGQCADAPSITLEEFCLEDVDENHAQVFNSGVENEMVALRKRLKKDFDKYVLTQFDNMEIYESNS